MEEKATRVDKTMPADVRLILLGSQRFGVNSVANRILGGEEGAEEFHWEMRNTRSVSRCAEVCGCRVQLVKAPVWFRGYHLCDTSELVKQELVLSVTHCDPGPHAFILLCEVDLPFTSACANAVTAHLSLFGDSVWKHTIILFTCTDWLGHTSLEKYLEGEGPHLAALLDRCGHRYVMDYTGVPAPTSPTSEVGAPASPAEALSHRLLEKVQELLATNEGAHFTVRQDTIEKIIQSREEMTKRAELRRKVRKEEMTRTKQGGITTEIVVVLLGWVFAAKTSVFGALCPNQLPKVDQRTKECVWSTRKETVGGFTVSLQVVDIPGWWKFFNACLVPNEVKAEINKAYDKANNFQNRPYSEAAFLLMLPADTSFGEEQLRNLTDNLEPLGNSVWHRTILVFTGGSWIQDFDIERHIESEEALVWLVERCSNRYFVFDSEAEQNTMGDQGTKLIQMVLNMGRKRGKQKETTKSTEVPPKVQPVDEDLKKMVDVLHQVWAWRKWEIQEMESRLDHRPMEGRDNSSMGPPPALNRSRVEDIVRDETKGKTLEELLKIVTEIYFRRECGAFDIVSIICDNEQFKPEWKSLFEREWARRESRLLDYTYTKYYKFNDSDKLQRQSYVEAWLRHSSKWIEDIEEPSIKEPVSNIIGRVKTPALKTKGDLHPHPSAVAT